MAGKRQLFFSLFPRHRNDNESYNKREQKRHREAAANGLNEREERRKPLTHTHSSQMDEGEMRPFVNVSIRGVKMKGGKAAIFPRPSLNFDKAIFGRSF